MNIDEFKKHIKEKWPCLIFVHSHPSVYYKIAYVYIKGFSTSLICFKNGIATTTYIVYNSKTNKLEEKGVYDRTTSLYVLDRNIKRCIDSLTLAKKERLKHNVEIL